MARTPVAFRTCFETACYVACGSIPTAASDDETKKLIDFNRTYAVGYAEGGGAGWTDARVGAAVTPVDRLISFDDIGDGRLWEVWDEDPRGNDAAVRLGFTEDSDGILLNEDADEVWMSWIPETVKFGNTSWATTTAYLVGQVRVHNDSTATTHNHCYRCLVAHTSGTFSTDLAAGKWVLVPVLAVLEEFVYAHMQGLFLIRNGQPQTGYAMQKEALASVEEVALAEINNRQRGNMASSSVASTTPASASSRYLSFAAAQTLTLAQKNQALSNLGISIASDGTITFPGGWTIVLNSP